MRAINIFLLASAAATAATAAAFAGDNFGAAIAAPAPNFAVVSGACGTFVPSAATCRALAALGGLAVSRTIASLLSGSTSAPLATGARHDSTHRSVGGVAGVAGTL